MAVPLLSGHSAAGSTRANGRLYSLPFVCMWRPYLCVGCACASCGPCAAPAVSAALSSVESQSVNCKSPRPCPRLSRAKPKDTPGAQAGGSRPAPPARATARSHHVFHLTPVTPASPSPHALPLHPPQSLPTLPHAHASSHACIVHIFSVFHAPARFVCAESLVVHCGGVARR